MNFSIIFTHTGDDITLQAINPELVEYYVERLNQENANSFLALPNKINNFEELVGSLNNAIRECSELSYLIDNPIRELTLADATNQQVLNQLHSSWVKSQLAKFNITLKKQQHSSELMDQIHHSFSDDIPTPTVGTVISTVGLSEQYGKINTYLHQIEQAFDIIRFKVADHSWISFDNPFDSTLATNDIANFRLTFNHLGRTLYNKFVNFDIDQCTDENTYKELLGFVSFHLVPPQTISFSPEYLLWCQRYNKEPTGNYLNLGNIVNLQERIADYRTIFFRNANNKFSIQL